MALMVQGEVLAINRAATWRIVIVKHVFKLQESGWWIWRTVDKTSEREVADRWIEDFDLILLH